jgi:hypothetical protein
MPYSIGTRGTQGCDEYPVINDADGSVVGCYDSLAKASAHHAWFVAIEERGSLEDLEEDS